MLKKKTKRRKRKLLSFAREMERREEWIPRELGKEIMFRMC